MKRVLLYMIFCALCLTGCSNIEQIATQKMEEKADIYNDVDYLKYESLKASGDLNASGEYVEQDMEEQKEEPHNGSIYVTFAENPYISIDYYKDAKHNERIENAEYCCNPGDYIYYEISKIENAHSDMYEFEGIRVYDIQNSGDSSNSQKEITCNANVESCYVQIPSTYEGDNLMLVPIGVYENKELKFKDYYVDENGKEVDVSGEWIVNNGMVNVVNDTASVDSISDYSVEYNYEKKYYYVESTNPKSINDSNDDGTVIFENQSSSGGVETFEIKLHRYINVTFKVKGSLKIYVDGEKKFLLLNKTIEAGQHKVGDEIIVESEKACTFESDTVSVKTTENNTDGYKYVLIVDNVSK